MLTIGALLAWLAVRSGCIWWYVAGLALGLTEALLNANADKKGIAHKLMQHHCKAAESLMNALNNTEYEDQTYRIVQLENIGEESMTGVYVKQDNIWLAIGTAMVEEKNSLRKSTFYYCCQPQFKSPKMLLVPNINLNKYTN
ncbi:MAG: hypothetical protein R3341_02630 [Methylophaga sp.]|nr:hypothetical protein [Methylophaga sp.]